MQTFRALQVFATALLCVPSFSTVGAQPRVDLVDLDNKVKQLIRANNFNRAMRLADRYVELIGRRYGTSSSAYARGLGKQARTYNRAGEYRKSIKILKAAIAVLERHSRGKTVEMAKLLADLARNYRSAAQYSESDKTGRLALATLEEAGAERSSRFVDVLRNLSRTSVYLGNKHEATLFAQRALQAAKSISPQKPRLIAQTHFQLGRALNNLGNSRQSEHHFRIALAGFRRLQPKPSRWQAQTLRRLAIALWKQNKFDEAEQAIVSGLKIAQSSYGRRHVQLAYFYYNLGDLYYEWKRYGEALIQYRRGRKILEALLPAYHYQRAYGPYLMARSFAALGDWKGAYQQAVSSAETANRVVDRLVGRLRRGDANRFRRRKFFRYVIEAAWHLSHRKSADEPRARRAFLAAQNRERLAAGGALVQSASIQTQSFDPAARLLYQRKRVAERWRTADRQLAKLSASGGRSNSAEAMKLRERRGRLERAFNAYTDKLSHAFPKIAEGLDSNALSLVETQKHLRSDEALLLIAVVKDGTFVWAITSTGAVWRRAPVGLKAMTEKVRRLRAGLSPGGRGNRAAIALIKRPSDPFDLATAHELYETLLGPVNDAIRDKKHLLVVPSGPLTALPFHVLVQRNTRPAPADRGSYRRVSWLVKRYAVTTLPSVSSLRALRSGISTRRQEPRHRLIGFADPVFSRSAMPRAKRARSDREGSSGLSAYFRGSRVDIAALGRLSPLPGTRTELTRVAELLRVDSSHLWLGEQATEAAVKLSDLDRYRIVYFATHGLVAGDVRGLAEPALALTPPIKADDDNDGLLTASEIAQLKLNADWLIMSACNTAAGDQPGAPALSGLARAFFFAGAKTLLVSHWLVEDRAAAVLTTHTFRAMDDAARAGNPIGRSEALRKAMLALMNDPSRSSNAHPGVWGPFVVIGEGGK